MKNTDIDKIRKNIVKCLLEYSNKTYDRDGLKLKDTIIQNGHFYRIFKLNLNDNSVEISLNMNSFDIYVYGVSGVILLYAGRDIKDFTNKDIDLINQVNDRLNDILYNYDNNQNIKPKNELIPKVIKIYELLSDKKHCINEYVMFDFGENDFAMTTKFSAEKNIKILIKDNKIYYTFHGTYVEYDKWTPTALYKITKIINNLLSNIKEIENDYLIKPICNPEEKNDENILLLI